MASVGISLPKKSKRVAVPVAEEEDPYIYRDGEDPEIDALFKEFDLLQATGSISSFPHVEGQGYISDPSHSPELFTLPTDVCRQLIREY